VIAYGVNINLVEVTWKSKLKAEVTYNLYDPACLLKGLSNEGLLMICLMNNLLEDDVISNYA